jgi:tetratricopeptide (TPR) repeat protein
MLIPFTFLLTAAVSAPPLAPLLVTPAPLLQKASGFDADLKKLHRYIDQRRWKEADQSLQAILQDYEKQDVVYANRAILLEDAQRIEFWKNAQLPDPDALISGTLSTYKAGKTAKIKVEYASGKLQDFQYSRDGSMFHPIRFTGPFTITLKGRQYPWGDPPNLIFGDSESLIYQVSFGTPAGKSYYPARIFKRQGEASETIDERDSIPLETGDPFLIEVKVSSKSISVKMQKKKILQAKRSKSDPYGEIWLSGFANADFEKITLEGEAATSWIDNLVDEAMQSQRRKFDQSYRPEKHLPAWLFAEADHPDEDPGVNRSAPAPYVSNRHRAWKQVGIAMARGRTADALKWLIGLEDDDLPDSHRAYLMVQLYYQLGDYAAALEPCRIVIAKDPNFLPSRLDEGWLLYHVDRASSFDVMRQVAEDFPNTLRPSQEYLQLLLMGGQLQQAHKFVGRIAKDRPRSPILDDLKSILVKADNGPSFTRTTEYSTEHYLVKTDMDREICIDAAQQLERMYRGYRLHLKGVPEKDKQKFRVFLFSGKSGFERYAEDVMGGGHANAAGLYSPIVKQLLIWNLPQQEEMFRTVQHEGFHQYLDRMMPDPPVWFNEGAASYFELVVYEKGKWKEGQVDANAVERLRGQGMMPLQDYIRLGNREFRSEEFELRNYAQGWLLTHFLRNSNRANMRLFEALFEGLCQAEDGQAAVERVLAEVDLDKLDADFRAHLVAM